MQKLTADRTEGLASSGRGWSERGGEGDLRRPTAKMKMMESLRASRGRVVRLGAPWSRGRAFGHGGRVSGVALGTVAANGGGGRSRVGSGKSRGGGGGPGRERGGREGVRGTRGWLQKRRKQEVARARAGARWPHALAYWREEEGDREPRWAGPVSWAAKWVGPGDLSLSLFLFCFSFCSITLWLY